METESFFQLIIKLYSLTLLILLLERKKKMIVKILNTKILVIKACPAAYPRPIAIAKNK